MATRKLTRKQRFEILDLRRKCSLREIEKATGVAKSQVARICGPVCVDHTERNKEVKRMRQAGKTLKQIAEATGLKTTRVFQICKTLCLLVVLFAGCDLNPQVRALPAPAMETPAVQVPLGLRQTNWRGPKGEGSCVYASLTSHARWQNRLELAEWIRKNCGDGETQTRLMNKLTKMNLPFACTEQASTDFLDWASATRRGCILWWKPSHCCTFLGYVERDGKTYCAILDNNAVGNIELTERSKFIAAWSSFGGFGLALLGDPASPRPWLSYEVVN